MEIITKTTDFDLNTETAVAIGKFDGVHLGHQRLLEEIVEKKKQGLKACVFTFDPAPAVLFGTSDGKELTTGIEKRNIFERMGIDILVEFPLTYETAAIAPEEFVREILCGRMGMAFIAAGYDVSFGAGGAGNTATLKRLASELHFEVKVIDKVVVEDIEVSSTYIRGLIESGQMREAERFLGMPYTVVGEVLHGNQIGRTLGFPTVNLEPPENKLLPPKGVYYSEVRFGKARYDAISNVGNKPTIPGQYAMGVETYLFDFAQEIYGSEIEVGLLDFKRPEEKFSSLEALKEQLQRDIQEGAAYHR